MSTKHNGPLLSDEFLDQLVKEINEEYGNSSPKKMITHQEGILISYC